MGKHEPTNTYCHRYALQSHAGLRMSHESFLKTCKPQASSISSTCFSLCRPPSKGSPFLRNPNSGTGWERARNCCCGNISKTGEHSKSLRQQTKLNGHPSFPRSPRSHSLRTRPITQGLRTSTAGEHAGSAARNACCIPSEAADAKWAARCPRFQTCESWVTEFFQLPDCK